MKSLLPLLALLILLAGCKAARLRKMEATQQVFDLKESFLLVRLNTGAVKAAALEEAGRAAAAKAVIAEQESANRRIREAFAAEYEFSPVYFFYADQSGHIRDRSFAGVVFDQDLDPADPEELEGEPFLVAEFSRIQPPAGQTGLPALIVMDDSLRQLQNPFPFYVRTTLLGQDQMEQRAVRILESKMRDFHSESRIWREKQALRERRRALRRQDGS